MLNPFKLQAAQQKKINRTNVRHDDDKPIPLAKDDREPRNSLLIDNFVMFKIVGANWIFVLLGIIGACGRGVIPSSFQYVMVRSIYILVFNKHYRVIYWMFSNLRMVSFQLQTLLRKTSRVL